MEIYAARIKQATDLDVGSALGVGASRGLGAVVRQASPPLRHCHMGQNENQISGNVQHIIAFGLHREWRVEMASGTGYQMPSPKAGLPQATRRILT